MLSKNSTNKTVATGDVYSLSSNPSHMFGTIGVGVNTAKQKMGLVRL